MKRVTCFKSHETAHSDSPKFSSFVVSISYMYIAAAVVALYGAGTRVIILDEIN